MQLREGDFAAEGQGNTLGLVVCLAICHAGQGKQGFGNMRLAMRAHHAVYINGDGVHERGVVKGKLTQAQGVGNNTTAAQPHGGGGHGGV